MYRARTAEVEVSELEVLFMRCLIRLCLDRNLGKSEMGLHPISLG